MTDHQDNPSPRYGIALGMGFEKEESIAAQIPLAAQAGYHAIATDWQPETPTDLWAEIARDNGLEFHYLHAPFTKAHTLWEEGAEGDAYADMLIHGLDACASAGVRNYVCHVIIGMERHTPTAAGLPRFRRMLDEAEAREVRIAFENTEGMEYLKAVMDEFAGHPACRFCWDTGHELCYNHAQDMLALFGDRLAVTHLDDNFGMTDPKVMTWLDDSHVMPGDGIADWAGIARRLREHHYDGILNMELNRMSRPERDTHAKYAGMTCLEFMRAALAALRRVLR